MFLNNLGNALLTRFEQTRNRPDLNRSIDMMQKAMVLTSDEHPSKPGRLQNLGSAFQRRFEETGLMDDLASAISNKEQAMEITPKSHPNHMSCVSNYCNSLWSRYDLSGSMADLDRAILLLDEALLNTPADHPTYASHLSNLGNMFNSRFGETGSISDLSRAIQKHQEALASAPRDHPNRAGYLNNFAVALEDRYRRTGTMEDLDSTINSLIEVLNLAPQNRRNRPGWLNNLGSALHQRFERTGSTDDLEAGIGRLEEAIKLTSIGHPERPGRLHNLASALLRRHDRTKSIPDLDRSIELSGEALVCPGLYHIRIATYLNTMGSGLQRRFEQRGRLEDLDAAITKKKEAVAKALTNDATHAGFFNNLSNALRLRFDRNSLIEDLCEAIEASQRAVNLMPLDHPARAVYLMNLGRVHAQRHEQTKSNNDLTRAISAYEKAVEIKSAPPAVRVIAANYCASLLIGQNNARALSLLRTAVNLLPSISPRSIQRHDRQYNISQLAGIAARAASLSIEAGEDPYDSLELLETGRGILAHLQLETRLDISALQSLHPDLAKEFLELREKLDLEPPPTISVVEIQSRRFRTQEFEDLLTKIRQLEHFERFLLGPSNLELSALTKRGTVVVFNVSEFRSDALLIGKGGIRSFRLTSLTAPKLEEHAKLFLQALQNSNSLATLSTGIRELKCVLEWLWDVAVGQVLDVLGYSQPPSSGGWKRVWWVGNGLLNVIPIHAAGYHDDASNRTALDRVISSYTPTVKSLTYVWKLHERVASLKTQRAMLLSMAKTPGLRDLPFAEQEVHQITKLFPAQVKINIIGEPTHVEVMSKIACHQIIHLACHGESMLDPFQSQLYLNDWKTAPLTVADLMSIKILDAQFAFLSACHTAVFKDYNLLDESIHLCSALQLAGYPSVVGSLWYIQDDPNSVFVSGEVYKCMAIGGKNSKLDNESSAAGLHHAVRELRERTRSIIPGITRKTPTKALLWAPFIHFGV
jgi:hypothetical protein